MDTYSCPGMHPSQAPAGAIFTPYVRFDFGGFMITTGNESAPSVDNAASIVSFQYGFGNGTVGWGAELEIVDVDGFTYRSVIRAINKSLTNSLNETLSCHFDFGWIIKYCNGTVQLLTAERNIGGKLYAHIKHVEQTFEGGKSKIKIKLAGPPQNINDVRHDDTMGDESQRITLKEAITELFTQNEPRFASVRFESNDGGELQFKKDDGGEDGPKGAWPLNQQNPLAAARTWLSSITTEKDLGILICYDPSSASIIFREAPDKDLTPCDRNVGTFIVNGGNCSPVLSFDPTINWVKGMIPNAGAATPGSSSGDNTNFVEPTIDIQKVGTQTSPTIQQHELIYRHPDAAAPKSREGTAAQMEANAVYEAPIGHAGFEADLKIIGDVLYSHPLALVGKMLSIIVINPFHLNEECTWITGPNCSTILSNKAYLIKGVSHSISEGSFTTTFNLHLLAPNQNIDANAPLGGADSGGETFDDALGISTASDANQ